MRLVEASPPVTFKQFAEIDENFPKEFGYVSRGEQMVSRSKDADKNVRGEKEKKEEEEEEEEKEEEEKKEEEEDNRSFEDKKL